MTQYVNRFGTISREMRGRTNAVVRLALANIHGRVVQSMQGIESPSRPGGPPAIVTGALAAGYDTKMVEDTVGVIYNTEEHAPHLELGTIHMAARPHLAPQVEAERPMLIRALGRTLYG